MTRTRTIALLGVMLVSGCAPRISSLLVNRHYREAICAGHDRTGEATRRRISEALAADSEIYLHVRRVELAELAALVGEPLAGEVRARVDLVKITVRSNTLPIDALQLDVTVQGEDMGAGAAPMGWETLAVATGERVPAPERQVSYLSIGNFLRALGAVATVGTSLPYTNFKRRTRMVPASSREYAQQMPKAAALLAALEPVRCDVAGPSGQGEVGQRCASYFVFDHSSTTRWTLTVAQTFVATREVADRSCSHVRATSVEVGAADGWGQVFGPRMRRIDELPGRAVTLGWARE